jgi:hypothetical protein
VKFVSLWNNYRRSRSCVAELGDHRDKPPGTIFELPVDRLDLVRKTLAFSPIGFC